MPEDFEKWAKPERFDFLDYDNRADGESSYLWADERGPIPVPDWVMTSGDATETGSRRPQDRQRGRRLPRRARARRQGQPARRQAISRHATPAVPQRRLVPGVQGDARTRARSGPPSQADALRLVGARATRGRPTRCSRLTRLWAIGVRVPYPVQRLGTEVLMEYIGDADHMAPRLVNAGASRDRTDRSLRSGRRRAAQDDVGRPRPRRPVALQRPGRGTASW